MIGLKDFTFGNNGVIMNVLFICTANVSRSFLAEMLLRHEIDRKNLKDVFVSSAGVLAAEGYPPDSKMIEYLLNLDIPSIIILGRLIILKYNLLFFISFFRTHYHFIDFSI